MGFTLADQYYLKARENFAYNMEASTQDLTYALGYDDNHAGANFLMGCYCYWYLHDFQEADYYFGTCIASNPQFIEIYPIYAQLFIQVEQYQRAEKLITYGLSVPGVCKSTLYQKQALINEMSGSYKEAKKCLNKALKNAFNDRQVDYISGELKRLKNKVEKATGKKKISGKKQKKKKK